MRDYEEHNSVMVPTEGEGVWGAEDAVFTYIRVRLIDLDYDIAEVYR